MSTAITSETETAAVATAVAADAIAAPTAAPVATTPAAPAAVSAAVDVSAIPETPAELLKQWQAPRRPLLHTVISATLVRFWDALTGPGMTQQERINRAIAEHNGFIRNLGRKV